MKYTFASENKTALQNVKISDDVKIKNCERGEAGECKVIYKNITETFDWITCVKIHVFDLNLTEVNSHTQIINWS